MAEKAKGSIIYEILIVVLAIGLIFTIVYPKKVWKQQDELQQVCRARMDALQQLEYRHMEYVESFTDSVPALKNNAMQYPEVVQALDSTINWDLMVSSDRMAGLISGLDFPEVLRQEIRRRIDSKEKLYNLSHWDSLEVKLVTALRDAMQDSLFSADSLEVAVDWRALVGENTFWDILSSDAVNQVYRRRISSEVQRGKPITETRDWTRFAPLFRKELGTMIEVARRTDVWQPEMKDEWEEYRLEKWMADMDTVSQADRDSVWVQYQEKLWDKNKELLWKDQWKGMWAQEKDAWMEENSDVWTRIVEKNWRDERKKQWLIDTKAKLPDSLAAIFTTIRDSLWNTEQDSIHAADYEPWTKKHEKEIDEIIKNLWERDRRISWTAETHDSWIAEKSSDPEALWTYLKDEVWLIEKDNLWRDTEKAYNTKMSTLNHLNKAVAWKTVLAPEKIDSIVSGLDLPDAKGMLDAYKEKRKEIATSFSKQRQLPALYQLGIVSLMRDELMKDLHMCPVAEHELYLTVVDTTIVPKFEIRCPIMEEDGKFFITTAIDTVTGDTLKTMLNVPFKQKVFGGGDIQNHGFIDFDGNRSWEKKTR